jgi:L-2-hydroxyglutarate oxidase
MSSPEYIVAIIGGGIVGLATALQLTRLYPTSRIAVIEKNTELATHQTGHNSGVIHSGIYYKPGSQKARLCVMGGSLLTEFCDENGVQYQQCGKVIVATEPSELPRLDELYRRGVANGVQGLQLIGPERLREIEPHATGIRALHVPTTGIVDYKQVAQAYASRVREAGGDIFIGSQLMGITCSDGLLVLQTDRGTINARSLINCAGLHADKVAGMMDVDLSIRIVPFRGEYYRIIADKQDMVRGLIYPVPDPALPFLGVHFTRTIHGDVEAGPNAVLALAREGYRKVSLNISESWGAITYPGFWRMSARFWKVGLGELYRSLSKRKFVVDLQRLLPAIRGEDLESGGAGVRAQAVDRDGNLVDDFRIEETERAIHVLNAPSPGATASLAIGRYIAERAASSFGLPK